MKAFASFIFNLFRNFSSILILSLLGILIYFIYNENAKNNFVEYLEEHEYIEDLSENNVYSSNMLVNNNTNFNSPERKKYKIKIKGGFAYLHLKDVMYIQSNPKRIMTKNGRSIPHTPSLKELEKILDFSNEEYFFRIKDGLVNCNFIQQLIRESTEKNGRYNYQNIIIMEDGEPINISESKAKNLKIILDKISI